LIREGPPFLGKKRISNRGVTASKRKGGSPTLGALLLKKKTKGTLQKMQEKGGSGKSGEPSETFPP